MNQNTDQLDNTTHSDHSNHSDHSDHSDHRDHRDHRDHSDHRDDSSLQQRLTRSLGISATPLLYKELSHAVVGAAIEVHRRLGPGKLESTYQRAMACELGFRAIPFVAQAPISMTYRGCDVGEFFADFIVDGKIIIELKAVERYAPVHKAQVLSYLSATRLRLGLLINFNVPVLWKSVCRVVR